MCNELIAELQTVRSGATEKRKTDAIDACLRFASSQLSEAGEATGRLADEIDDVRRRVAAYRIDSR
jgi:hypothetical protein